MVTDNRVVMELVQTSVSISSQHYKDVYNNYMQPILLSQPGMLLALAGVVIPGSDETGSQEHDTKVLSLVVWESVSAHVAFASGDAAIPFFEASKPLMNAPPSIEHYHIDGLQPPAFGSHYARVLKASSASGKELLARIQERYAAIEGIEMTVLSDCLEDASQTALILFGSSDRFEAAADVTSEDIKSFTVMWYSRGVKNADELLE